MAYLRLLMVVSSIPNEQQGATSTSIVLWLVAGAVVMLGMQPLPLIPDRLWRFICWSMAVVIGFYAAARIRLIPSGWIWLTWALLLILVLALAFWVESLLSRREIEATKEQWRPAAIPTPTPSVEKPASPADLSREPIFDEAPPELADMSPASLKELIAGRTDAQSDKLMEQHVGKRVRVSGEVESVTLGRIPQVQIRSSIALVLFFDATENYDVEPVLLAINKGDEITVSGQIFKIHEITVSLDYCKLIEARGQVS